MKKTSTVFTRFAVIIFLIAGLQSCAKNEILNPFPTLSTTEQVLTTGTCYVPKNQFNSGALNITANSDMGSPSQGIASNTQGDGIADYYNCAPTLLKEVLVRPIGFVVNGVAQNAGNSGFIQADGSKQTKACINYNTASEIISGSAGVNTTMFNGTECYILSFEMLSRPAAYQSGPTGNAGQFGTAGQKYYLVLTL